MVFRAGTAPIGEIPETTTRVIRAVVVETRYEGSGSLTLGCRLSRSRSPADSVGQESMVEPLPPEAEHRFVVIGLVVRSCQR